MIDPELISMKIEDAVAAAAEMVPTVSEPFSSRSSPPASNIVPLLGRRLALVATRVLSLACPLIDFAPVFSLAELGRQTQPNE